MCAGRVFHANDALKKKEVVCLVVRAAGRILFVMFLATKVASNILIFAKELRYDPSKFSDDFTPFFLLWKTYI